MTETAAPERKRSVIARIGLTALNLLTPGLGLIRIGRWREGLKLAAASQLTCWLPAIAAFLLPVGSFAILLTGFALASLATLTVLVIACVRTWRGSRDQFSRRWWTRWYALILWYAIDLTIVAAPVALFHRAYHSFYIASISMAPTFAQNEKVLADMRWRTPQIGNIILVRDRNGVARIYRVAALGGQTFAMRHGVPIIDGHPATQREVGPITISDSGIEPQSGRVLREHLPGETGEHRIAQLAGYPQDEVTPQRVPPGSIYLLGDDRDMAADSRIPLAEEGIGPVPVSTIIGRPLYILWSRDHSRIGQRADH
ncbi:signal peptidase I [Sphingomonas sp. ASY06-1R]|uniref:signal peptidase I n=1 Tax=Sphingomonas sp. ASY06-1R TaxID=3445771 RepID=UPI003FA24B60